jgi:hypothetical protein
VHDTKNKEIPSPTTFSITFDKELQQNKTKEKKGKEEEKKGKKK